MKKAWQYYFVQAFFIYSQLGIWNKKYINQN